MEPETIGCDGEVGGENGSGSVRAEIDTSAPFESVKEAVSRFGGVGYWKPHHYNNNKKLSLSQNDSEEIGLAEVEEQAALLEKDLTVKEKETLDVIKELEATKMVVEELKLKLQKQVCEVDATLGPMTEVKDESVEPLKEEKRDNNENDENCIGSGPGLILMELKQAKVNLSMATSDLADVRASVEMLNKKLEKERISLEKTREKLTFNSSKISSLEEELNQTKQKLQLSNGINNPMDISVELRRLSSEAEQFKKMGEAAKSEVSRAISEIEQTKTKIRTAEIRLVAARKMKEASRAAEAVALAEIKALSRSETEGDPSKDPDGVTLTFEEYSSLTRKAREAEELLKTKINDAMMQVDEASVSKMEILKKVEKATEEVKTTKKALEEALSRVEAANRGKLEVEEALRKWRAEHGQKHRSVQNTTKFKNSGPSDYQRRESILLDVNGINLSSDVSAPILKPTLSIGQILSRKLMAPEEFDPGLIKGRAKRKVSLAQILGKQNSEIPSKWKNDQAENNNNHNQFNGKRKKFGFARFSLLLTKESKKKKASLNLR